MCRPAGRRCSWLDLKKKGESFVSCGCCGDDLLEIKKAPDFCLSGEEEDPPKKNGTRERERE